MGGNLSWETSLDSGLSTLERQSETDTEANLYENIEIIREEAEREGGENVRSAVKLVGRVKRKLERLRERQVEVDTALKDNEFIAEDISCKLALTAPEKEVAKYELQVREWDEVTYLLLGLVTRLAKMEKCVDQCEDCEERRHLT